jgi:hypothetical protein
MRQLPKPAAITVRSQTPEVLRCPIVIVRKSSRIVDIPQ